MGQNDNYPTYEKICTNCRTVYQGKKRAVCCFPCSQLRRLNASRCAMAVLKAVKENRLPKLDGNINCVDCGQIATEYDHRDYDKPLEVEPVCRSCNGKRGAAINGFKDNYDKRRTTETNRKALK